MGWARPPAWPAVPGLDLLQAHDGAVQPVLERCHLGLGGLGGVFSPCPSARRSAWTAGCAATGNSSARVCIVPGSASRAWNAPRSEGWPGVLRDSSRATSKRGLAKEQDVQHGAILVRRRRRPDMPGSGQTCRVAAGAAQDQRHGFTWLRAVGAGLQGSDRGLRQVPRPA